jgi:hypothetical protein
VENVPSVRRNVQGRSTMTKAELVDAIANGPNLAKLIPPAMKCPECGAQMAFNDFPERYFSFLAPASP